MARQASSSSRPLTAPAYVADGRTTLVTRGRARDDTSAGDALDELGRLPEDPVGAVVERGHVVAVVEQPLLEVAGADGLQDGGPGGRVDDVVDGRAEVEERLRDLGQVGHHDLPQ